MKKQLAMAAALFLASGGVMAQDTVKAAAAAKQPADSASEMPKLMVGDKAPAITVAKWVKGEPVTGFEKGKTYVVEFWATWCGPCKVSIPHLTEMQKANPDVKFIGVSVWENDQSKIEPFVKDEMGDKMVYTVCSDDVPNLPEDAKAGSRAAQKFYIENGKMSKNWMSASGSGGIPTAFIVNGEGKVAWIGHPMMKMDDALAKVISGKQDLAADAAEYRKDKENEAKMKPLQRKFSQAMQEGDHKAALAAMDEIVALNPKMAKQMAGTKYTILMNEVKDYDAAYKFGNELLNGAAKDDAQMLNQIAWLIVDPDNKPEKLDLALAEKASQRSNELTKNSDGMLMDTLAAVYFAKKDYAKAAEYQEKAVKLIKDQDNIPEQVADEMKERLAKFKKAAEAGGS